MVLNAQSPVPLYRQLAARISDSLESGQYPVGTRIPSENELAAEFGIGRPTVRQATDHLVRQGRLERRRGSGTFAVAPPQTIDLFSLTGTSAALSAVEFESQLEVIHGPELVENKVGKGQTEESPHQQVLLERRALVDSTPVLYERFLFSADVFPGLEYRNLTGCSISALIRDEYYLEPTSARQTFHVETASDTDCKKLAVSSGSALLRVSRDLFFGAHGKSLSVDILCRTDRFEFTQVLYPAEVSAQNAGNKVATQLASV